MLWRLMRSQCFAPEGEGGGESGAGSQQSNDAHSGGNGGKDDGASAGESSEFKPITSQEDFEAALKLRLDRQEKSLRTRLADDIRKQLKDEADAAEATKQGDFEKLYKAELQKREAAERERDTERLTALRARIAAKHKLPSELADRLSGATEDEIETDAKALAKIVGPRQAPDTEAGSGTSGKNSGGEPPRKPKQQGPVYTFDGKQKVAWPDRR